MKQIKTQIKSVSNIKQITKALEVVSTIKLQKIKQQSEQYRDFMVEFMRIVQVLNQQTALFQKKHHHTKNSKKLIVVLSSDRGLCGGLNNRLFKETFTQYEGHTHTDIFCVGKKALEYFSRTDFNVIGHTSVSDDFTEDELHELFTFLNTALANETYDEIDMAFNYFQTAMQQVPVNLSLFPLNKKSFINFTEKLAINIESFVTDDIKNKEILLEPSAKELARETREQLIQHMIYGAILQNKAGEFASRMIAMKNAKDNSTSLIKDLKLSFNKARQAAVTQEVSEIMSAKMAIEK